MLNLRIPLISCTALAALACGETRVDTQPTRPQQALGTFTIDVDPAAKTATIRKQAIHAEVPFGENNDPDTNPPGTIQAITTVALEPGQGGCPMTQNCFTVVVRNFTGATQNGVFMGIDSITPATGRSLDGGDPVPPAVVAPLGGVDFGDLADDASSAPTSVIINVPDGAPYTVSGRFWGDQPIVLGPIDQDAPTNNACMANYSQTDTAQSFQTQIATQITGAGVFHDSGAGTGNCTISLWDALPNAMGNMLASGTGPCSAGSYTDVAWAPVPITAGTTYFLVFTADGAAQNLCIAGDVNGGYAFGDVFANPGFDQFPGFDYTFRTYR